MKKNLIGLIVIIIMCLSFIYFVRNSFHPPNSVIIVNPQENELESHDNPFTEVKNLEFIDEYTQQQMISPTCSQKESNAYTRATSR